MLRNLTFLVLLVIGTLSSLSTSTSGVDAACAPNSEFQCGDGSCISKNFLCDGLHQCTDQSDEKGCPVVAKKCPDGFSCDKNTTCISHEWVCDGNKDCLDGTDESSALCAQRNCPADKFRCTKVGQCIPLEWRCDGEKDCSDYSDEESCDSVKTCSTDQFRCAKDGSCLAKSWVCDDNHDCVDGSDEKDCPSKSNCKEDEFQCNNKRCIDTLWHCDGFNDCNDNSDEKNCASPLPLFTCKVDEFKCREMELCISQKWMCDGEKDCPDGSDEEENCQDACKAKDAWKCRESTQCIPKHLKCDGHPDCKDQSDELQCESFKCHEHYEFNCNSNPPQCVPLSAVCDKHSKDCSNNADEDLTICSQLVDECKTNKSNCTQKCHDLPVGFYCDCEPGYALDSTKTVCVDIDECQISGSCSQKCVNTAGSYHCSCIDGYYLDPPTKKCKAIGAEPFLLLANKNNIRKLSLRSSHIADVLSRLQSVIAIDFDYKGDRIFWSDHMTQKIQSGNLSHNDDENPLSAPVILDIAMNVSDVDGLAYDWIHQLLYFTSHGDKYIGVVQTNLQNHKKKLITEGLSHPRAIVVDPNEGWLYWSDWGEQPKIERAGMNGFNRKIIITDHIVWPNGLTIDYVDRRLYWVDAKLHLLSSSDLDGRNQKMILMSEEHLAHPFSISVFEDWVYWTDWVENAIFKLEKFGSKESNTSKPEVIRHQISSPMDIKVFHLLRQTNYPQRCGSNNGGCSHLCLPVPHLLDSSPYFACDCPDGMMLNGGSTCISESPVKTSATVPSLPSTITTTKQKPAVNTSGTTSVPSAGPAASPSEETSQQRTSAPQAHEDANSFPVGHVAGIAIGAIVSSLVLIAMIVLLVVRMYRRSHIKSMNFDNPVYRKTTEEECFIKDFQPGENYPSSFESLAGRRSLGDNAPIV